MNIDSDWDDLLYTETSYNNENANENTEYQHSDTLAGEYSRQRPMAKNRKRERNSDSTSSSDDNLHINDTFVENITPKSNNKRNKTTTNSYNEHNRSRKKRTTKNSEPKSKDTQIQRKTIQLDDDDDNDREPIIETSENRTHTSDYEMDTNGGDTRIKEPDIPLSQTGLPISNHTERRQPKPKSRTTTRNLPPIGQKSTTRTNERNGNSQDESKTDIDEILDNDATSLPNTDPTSQPDPTYRTFIVHYNDDVSISNYESNFQTKKVGRGSRPNYAYFIHKNTQIGINTGNTNGPDERSGQPGKPIGGHIHVVYESNSTNNKRKRENIGRDLLPSPSASTEISVTDIPIHDINRYIHYLFRQGINSGHYVGDKNTPLYRLVTSIKGNNQTRQNIIIAEKCIQYLNEKRTQRKISNNENIDNSTKPNIYRIIHDIINPIIKDNSIKTWTDFARIISPDIDMTLFFEYGPRYKGIAEYLIDRNQEKVIQINRTTPILLTYFKYTMKDNSISTSSYIAFKTWIQTLFALNDINLIKFLSTFVIIQDKLLNKQNSFVIQGPTNTSKSTILTNMLAPIEPTVLMRLGDQGTFYFQNARNTPAILFEEPTITPATVNNFKLLMGGEKTATDVKNQNAQEIPRTPCYFTTNIDLGTDIGPIHRAALESRYIRFEFQTQVNDATTDGGIHQCPTYIKPYHFAKLTCENSDKIKDYITRHYRTQLIKPLVTLNEEQLSCLNNTRDRETTTTSHLLQAMLTTTKQ